MCIGLRRGDATVQKPLPFFHGCVILTIPHKFHIATQRIRIQAFRISIFRCVGNLCGNKSEIWIAERVFGLKARFLFFRDLSWFVRLLCEKKREEKGMKRKLAVVLPALAMVMVLLLGLSVFFVACDSGTESGGQNTEQGGEEGGEGETGGEDPAPVPDVSDKLVFTLNDEETAYSVTDMDASAAGSVTIPATYDGLPVTSIGSRAFAYCSSLAAVTIPASVTSIGNGAFYECSSLTEITIPEGVTSIGQEIFSRCSRLIKVTIPEGVTSIGSEAFAFCVSLTEITLPASVTRIDSYAFYDCVKLIEIYNKSVLPLAEYNSDYGGVASYAKNIYTPQEGRSWFTDTDGYRFFYDGSCGYLMGYYGTETALTLPAKFTAYNGVAVEGYIIYSYAFAFGSDFTEIVIPDSVTGIGAEGTFANCSSMTEFTIPDCVTNIGESMFSGCSNLQLIRIPDGVMSIGLLAFSDCNSLTEITIPESVELIQRLAFRGCSSLTSAVFENTEGWFAGEAIQSGDLADPATAATYLKSTYYSDYWYRS